MKCCRKVYLDWGTGWQDVSHLVKSDTLTITKRAASNTYHKAQNYVSFTLIYEQATFQAIYDATEKIKVQVIAETTESLYPSDTLYPSNTLFPMSAGATHILFTGIIPPTASRKYNGILDNTTLSMEGVDSQDLLDVEVGDWYLEDCTIMNPANKAKSIIHQLAYLAGFTDSQIDQTITISKYFDAFAPNGEKDKILTIMDILLFEHGYVFNMNSEDQISPVQWIGVPSSIFTFEEEHIIKEITVKEKERNYDAIEVTWYELDTMDNVRIYTESLPYANNGQFEGYPVPSTYYYPVEANVTDRTTGSLTLVYQEYTNTGIEYKTNEAILNNLDYNYKAFDSDFSSIIITKNHVLYDDREGLTLVASEFGNKKARILYRNNQATSQNLYYMYINATVTYKSSERILKAGIETTSELTDKYESYFIFDAESADILAQNMVQMYGAGNTEYKFDSEIEIAEGTLVNLITNDATNLTCFVTEKQYSEKTGLFSYTLVGYAYNEGVVISEGVSRSSGAYEAYATAVAAEAQATAVAAQAAVDSKITLAQVPEYRGRYLNAGPTTDNNNGDTCTVYSTVLETRGIYKYTTSWVKQTTPTMQMISNAWVDICAVTTSGMITGAPYGVVEDYIGSQVNFIESLVANEAFINELRTKTIQFTESVSSIETDTLTSGDRQVYIGKDPRHPEDAAREYEFALQTYLGMDGTEEKWMKHFWTKIMTNGMIGLLLTGGLQSCGPVTSNPGQMWEERASPFGTLALNTSIYGNNKYVIGASLNTLAYSTDGVTWTLVASPPFSALNNVYDLAYGNGKFIAVSDGGKVAYSTDGISWTLAASTLFGGYSIYSVTYGDNKYVVGSYNGRFAYSTDGNTWTTSPSTVFGGSSIESITFGGGQYVAVGDDGKIGYSTDGNTWTLASSVPFGTYKINAVAYGNGIYVAGCYGGGIAYSIDGGIWTLSSSGGNGVMSITYGNGKFVGAGGASGTLKYSVDGILWQSENITNPFGALGVFKDVSWSEERQQFIAIGNRAAGAGSASFILSSDALEAGAGIVEKGRSTDGKSDYILFSDGTLICKGRLPETTAWGTTIVFPYAFRTTDNLVVNLTPDRNLSDKFDFIQPFNVLTSSFRVNGKSSSGSNQTMGFNYIAIGRAAI